MPEPNKIYCGDWIEVAETLPSGIAHCIITSPAYWGQRLYGWDGDGSCEEKKEPHVWQIDEPIQTCLNCGMMAPTLGLEKTPEEHIEKLVVGFRELRRVLRDDGVVFLNYGDKYNAGRSGGHAGGKHSGFQQVDGRYQNESGPNVKGLKQGDLIGLAWRLALALQADGWYLRSDIIWAKALSFCDKYSGSTMPESVNGWRWERHKIKVKSGWDENQVHGSKIGKYVICQKPAQWKPCPGCAKCAPDGLILRKGSWRPTRAHEYLFQLTKTSSYFCDMEAVREAHAEPERSGRHESNNPHSGRLDDINKQQAAYTVAERNYNPSGRNLRDVFCINPQAYPDSHYATFPEKLVEPCIKVGTSEKGCCPKCGAQWARIVDTGQLVAKTSDAHCNTGEQFRPKGDDAWSQRRDSHKPGYGYENTTLGWLPTCKCGIKETVPCIVYDPFMGSGTVAAVAARLGRNYIGSELNEDYVKNQAAYRVAEGETGISKQEQRQGQGALFPVEKQ